MKIFNRLSSTVHYWIDSYKVNYSKTRVEKFQFDHTNEQIIVVYRVGNKRLLDKLPINKFEHDHFDSCSNFDQHRLTKFSTLQKVLENISSDNGNCKTKIIDFIDNKAKNEQLFWDQLFQTGS